jgi:signal transduction histidine kinase/ligand-binding sensor domain-containing protein
MRLFRWAFPWLLLAVGSHAYTAESVDSTPLTQYRHRAWRASDGWFDSTILAVAQGSDGYLWVGTQSGLLRFDGVRFSPWMAPRGLEAPGRVRYLLATKDGAMWIGSSSELQVFKGNELTRVPLEGGVIESLYEDHTGQVWATRAGLKAGALPVCNVSARPMKCYGPADGLTIGYATGITEDPDGYYWVGSGRLVRWRPGTPQVDYFADELKSFGGSIGIADLLTQSDGTVLAGLLARGDKAGLQSFKDGKWQSVKARGFDGGASGGRVLLEDREGALWIAPYGSGLVHLKNGQADTFTREDGLSGDRVTSIRQDAEGTVWVATNHGIDNFSRMPVVTYTAREGMPAGPPSAVAANPDGTVFVATPRPVTIKEGVPAEAPGFPGILNEGVVQALLVDSQRSVWLAKGNQLYLQRDGKVTVVKTPDGANALPVGAIVTAMAEDRQHTIWGLLDGVGLKQLVTITADGMRAVADLPYGDTGFLMVIDHADGLWMAGGTRRLNYFHDGKVVNQTLPDGNDDFSAHDLFVDSQNRLWIMSTNGLKVVAEGRVRSIDKENGLPCAYFDGGIIDREETVWVTGRCGLLRIEEREWRKALASPGANINFQRFGAPEGWTMGSTVAVPKIAQSADGKIWFAGAADLQMLDPRAVATVSKSPSIHIEQVVVDHKQYDPRLPLESIPPNPRELEIDYTAPTALNPRAIRFKYRLVGHDESWQEPGTRRQAFYSDLKPGPYRFEVALDGPSNASKLPLDHVEFSVLPAFYQSWWFRVVCAVAAFIALWSIYAIRVQRVTELLRVRHQERMIERESMARDLHDTFFQSVQSLFLRFHTAANRLPEHEPTRLIFENALDDSDRVMLQGRQVMLDLRAESSKSMTLAEALALAGNDLRSAYHCDFRVTVVGVLRPLFPLVFEELRKFGQEALANAFRHSRAQTIEVEINYGSSEFSVRVRDDGVGIEEGVLKPGFRQGHWGLPGMRERAAKIGGRLEIWSRSGAGTEIELKLPARAAYVTGPRRAFVRRWLRFRR